MITSVSGQKVMLHSHRKRPVCWLNYIKREKINKYIDTNLFTIVGTDRTICRHGYTMVHDIWNMRLGVDAKNSMDVDVNGEFIISPNASRLSLLCPP